jgi:3-oxoacyl-[acyl-carrier protein] reductase
LLAILEELNKMVAINQELKGRVALITGAAQGIGKATALKLSELGAQIAVNDLPGCEKAEAVVAEIQARGGDAITVLADVADSTSVQSAISSVANRFGKIDILVNNVGVHLDSFVLNMPEKAWHKVIDTNLSSNFLCAKYVLRFMLEQHWGRVINITSVAGIIGNARRANYSASKAGIIAFTKSLALEVGSRNITVNAIAPGLILTESADLLPESEKNAIMSGLSIKRFGRPEDIAELVAFLSTDRAGYITSQVIRVDGGYC